MTPYFIVARETAHKGKRVTKFLRRPGAFGLGRNWSWAQVRLGAARFQSENEASAHAKLYGSAFVVRVES